MADITYSQAYEQFDRINNRREQKKLEAIEHAKHQDWQSIEYNEQAKPIYTDFVDTINDIDIYYCFASDTYLFAKNEE